MKRKRKPKSVCFKLSNLVWQYALFVRAGGTEEQAERWFRRAFQVPDAEFSQVRKSRTRTLAHDVGTSATTWTKQDEKSHMIWFEACQPSASIVAHEAVHSASHVLGTSGLAPQVPETEEAYAYLVQWTVGSIGNRLW